ncbi:MAG TPA: SH3 domain-containing protein [Kofleriaceae bacterium]
MHRGLAIAVAFFVVVHAAAAEPTRTNSEVALRKRPGEKQAVVATLPAGTTVVIEAEAGRWLRVRAGSVVGYLTRTTLVQPPATPTTSGAWGAKAPQLDQVAATPTAPTVETTAVATPEPIVPPPSPALRADVAIGYRSLGYDFSSNGSAGLANYLVSADAAAASMMLDGSRRFGRISIGGDAEASASTSSPGIEYTGPSGPGGDIPFSTVAARGGVRAGTAVDMYDLALRAGIHYDAFLPRDVENAGKLPRERLLGATLGVRAQVAPPRTRVAVALRFDALVFGNRRQTPGLEDGESSEATAVWAGATIRVALAHHLALVFAYDFGRASTHWSGMSVREPSVSDASRVDSSQLVQLGVSAGL